MEGGSCTTLALTPRRNSQITKILINTGGSRYFVRDVTPSHVRSKILKRFLRECHFLNEIPNDAYMDLGVRISFGRQAGRPYLPSFFY